MRKKINLAIDASNIRQGGGVTHLTQLLKSVDIEKYNVSRVFVWASKGTASRYPERSWLTVLSPSWVDANPIIRFLCQFFLFHFYAKKNKCDVVFSPGGTISFIKILPVITMSQNLLPFEFSEMNKFGIMSGMWLKLFALRLLQSISFIRADGVIFLTKYAENCVKKGLFGLIGDSSVVPHGIEQRFFVSDRNIKSLDSISRENPHKVLYVSITMPYKHQIEVARAVQMMRSRGTFLEISFVGPKWGDYHNKFMSVVNEIDPRGDYIKWLGEIPFDLLHNVYSAADSFVFASSCENMPNILIEAMSSGLPVASSDCGPMPEILGNSGVYFDPNDPTSIATALDKVIKGGDVIERMRKSACEKSKLYSWGRCGNDTFDFICRVAAK